MGQQDVYDYLRGKRLINDDSYYSVKEIYLALKSCNPKSISESIKKLYLGRFLERRLYDGRFKYRCCKDMI